MPDTPDQNSLDAALLRAEQNFFEQAQVQVQQLTALQNQLAELEQTIQILRHQLAQAQEEIDTANSRLEHTLETQVDRICLTQLAQAHEELEHALRQLDALQEWQHLARSTIKLPLKLLIQTLLGRLFNRLRWLIPLQGARRIKSFLVLLRQRLFGHAALSPKWFLDSIDNVPSPGVPDTTARHERWSIPREKTSTSKLTTPHVDTPLASKKACAIASP